MNSLTKITAALSIAVSATAAQAWTGYVIVPAPNGAQAVGAATPQSTITDQISAWSTVIRTPQRAELRIVQPCGQGGEAKIFDSSGRTVGVRVCPLR